MHPSATSRLEGTDGMDTTRPAASRDTTFSFAAVIRAQARERANTPALTFGDETRTFAELDLRSTQLANSLIAAGVGQGDRVAVLSKNAPVFYELAFACSKAGAVLAGLNWRLAPAEIEAVVSDAEPTVIVVADEQRLLLTDAALATPAIRLVLSLERDYERFLGGGSAEDPLHPSDPDDVALLLYTSGTTGVPKGAELTNRNLSYTEDLAREAWSFTSASVNLVGMPMFHSGGIGYGMAAMIVGGHTVLIRDNDPSSIIAAVTRHRVTHAFFVPGGDPGGHLGARGPVRGPVVSRVRGLRRLTDRRCGAAAGHRGARVLVHAELRHDRDGRFHRGPATGGPPAG